MDKKSEKAKPDILDAQQRQGIRLLLVDDEKAFVEVLSNRLGKRGIDVGMAHSGSAAIQLLRQKDFDIAVLDLKMEDMDGIEVLQILKKMVPKMPIIILTGHGSEQALNEGLAYGAYDYLMKPCDFDDLLSKIREAVEQGES